MSAQTGTAMAGWLWAMAVVFAPAATVAQIATPPAARTGAVEAGTAGTGTAQTPPRGLFGDLGELFTPPPAAIWSPPPLKSPAQAIEEFNARAKDAGDSLSRLGRGPVVTGRAVCPVAANGAPDCEAAASRLCRDNGFRDGKSTDVESAQVCSAQAVLSRRTDEPGACRMENYVTRAMCQ
jgi:hypothetical protein